MTIKSQIIFFFFCWEWSNCPTISIHNLFLNLSIFLGCVPPIYIHYILYSGRHSSSKFWRCPSSDFSRDQCSKLTVFYVFLRVRSCCSQFYRRLLSTHYSCQGGFRLPSVEWLFPFEYTFHVILHLRLGTSNRFYWVSQFVHSIVTVHICICIG